jgi:hypothetical protein
LVVCNFELGRVLVSDFRITFARRSIAVAPAPAASSPNALWP